MRTRRIIWLLAVLLTAFAVPSTPGVRVVNFAEVATACQLAKGQRQCDEATVETCRFPSGFSRRIEISFCTRRASRAAPSGFVRTSDSSALLLLRSLCEVCPQSCHISQEATCAIFSVLFSQACLRNNIPFKSLTSFAVNSRTPPDEKLREICHQSNELTEVIAAAAVAAKRELGLELFDVQLQGALALANGRIAEMQTGEGKTLTAVPAVIWLAKAGAGVHVMTVNDYLARRDARWMGAIYERLGFSVGCIQQGMLPAERKRAYACDITYATANEIGFDYLARPTGAHPG